MEVTLRYLAHLQYLVSDYQKTFVDITRLQTLSDSESSIIMKSTEQAIATVFDSEPNSQMHEYKLELEKICNELLKFGLTKNQAKVFIYLGKYGSKTSPEVCKALKLP